MGSFASMELEGGSEFELDEYFKSQKMAFSLISREINLQNCEQLASKEFIDSIRQ